MIERLYAEEGATAYLGDLLDHYHAATVFLVRDRFAYGRSGAEVALTPCLAGRRVIEYFDFELNPRAEDVDRGLAEFRAAGCEAVVAIGGGSTIDMAKLVRIVGAHDGGTAGFIRGERRLERRGVPLIAIPTTAGSGSEATHFAVAYLGGEKYSVADELVRADHVILDPRLTWSMPPRVTAATGLDALCQGIESYWSVHSTVASREWSRAAVTLATAHLRAAVADPTPRDREAMLQAAHSAGMGIDVAKTTAPHALSYALTSGFGVPHGHAVALTMGPVFAFNAGVTDDDICDRRGVDHVVTRVAKLADMLELGDPCDAPAFFARLLGEIGLATRLRDVGVGRGDLGDLAGSVNLQRLANNPRRLSEAALGEILEQAF